MMGNYQDEEAKRGGQALKIILVVLIFLCLFSALGGLMYFYFTKAEPGEVKLVKPSSVLIEKEIDDGVIKNEWLTCLNDDDCMAVSKSCCDCSEINNYVFLNKNFEQEFYSSFDCLTEECDSENECLPTKQYCNEGRCTGERNCVGNGEPFSIYSKTGNVDIECCPGLEETVSGISGVSYCVKCGDGECISPETYLTCSSDCAIGSSGGAYSNGFLLMSFKSLDGWKAHEREDGFDLVSYDEKEKIEFRKFKNDKSWINIDAEVVDTREVKIDGVIGQSVVYRSVLSDGELVFFNYITVEEKNLEIRSINSLIGFDRVSNFLLKIQVEISFVDKYKTSEWVEYSDPVLGISFFHPVEWGDVVLNEIDLSNTISACGASGKIYNLGFSFFNDLILMAYSGDLKTCLVGDGPSSYEVYSKISEKGQEVNGRFDSCSSLFVGQENLVLDEFDMFNCEDVLVDKKNLYSYYQVYNRKGEVFNSFEFFKIIPLSLSGNEVYKFLDIKYFFNDLRTPSNDEVFEFASSAGDSEIVLNKNKEFLKKASENRELLKRPNSNETLSLKIGLFDKFVELLRLPQENNLVEDIDIKIDFDGDGLSDEEELLLGTDPMVADTDGDGYLDGDEVERGYNPLGE